MKIMAHKSQLRQKLEILQRLASVKKRWIWQQPNRIVFLPIFYPLQIKVLKI